MSVVVYEKKDGIAIITINRPEAGNAITKQVQENLEKAWTDVRDDPQVRVAILTGAGERVFCSGGDPNEPPDTTLMEEIPGGLKTRLVHDFKGFPFWKPVVCAINGHAVGDGANMVLATDIRIASERATFFWPEARMGAVPFGGALARLARQIPYCHAMRLLLTGDRLDAQEALRIGLINEVVPLPELMLRARQVAQQLAEAHPLAVRVIKEGIVRGLNMGLEQALVLESLYAEWFFSSAKQQR